MIAPIYVCIAPKDFYKYNKSQTPPKDNSLSGVLVENFDARWGKRGGNRAVQSCSAHPPRQSSNRILCRRQSCDKKINK